MDILDNITTLRKEQYPYLLHQISRLPRSMDMIGTMPPETYKYLCVVGSREHSSYGKDVCEQLIAGLTTYPIVIVSGLALGIDSIAHEAALRAGLKTIAFPGSGLNTDVIYPPTHIYLARKIIESGGTILSPFKRDQIGAQWTFPVRNRLMAGISHATLIIEADEDSGTLLTAGNAGEFNRDVLTVPGSIFSPLSHGPHTLLRDGAIAVTSSEDILEALGLKAKAVATEKDRGLFDQNTNENNSENNPHMTIPSTSDLILSLDEKSILEKMIKPVERDELIRSLTLPVGYINALLIELELKNIITERQGLLMIV